MMKPLGDIIFLQGTASLGGSKISLLNILRTLQELGVSTFVLCGERGWFAERLEALGIPHAFVPFPGWRKALHRPFMDLVVRFVWTRALRETQPAVVHSNELWWAPHAVKLGRIMGIPSVAHHRAGAHDIGKARQYCLHEVSALITVSNEVREKFKMDRTIYLKMKPMFLGFEVGRDKSDGKDKAKQELGIPRSAFVIGVAGRLCANKNQRRLALGLAGFLQEHSEALLLLAGDGDPEYESGLRNDLRRLGVHDQAKFLGRCDDMRSFYRSLDVLAHFSLSEGLPRVVVEAMLEGKAVVAADVEGVREVISNDTVGIVVAIDDVGALEKQMRSLYHSPGIRERMGHAAREHAARLFDRKRNAENLIELYTELADKFAPQGQ